MTSKASLHVRVLNQNRQPVKDALITANNRTALSDDNGRATLAVTFPATVTVQKSGSSTQTRTLQQDDQRHQTFFLAPPTVVTYTVGQTVIPLAAQPDMLIAVLQSYVTEALAEDGYLTTLLSSLNIPRELLWRNYEAFLNRGLLPLHLNQDEKTLHLETSAIKLIDDLAKTLLEKKEIASVGQPVYIQGDQCAFLTASALVKLRTNTSETTIDTLCTRHGFTNPKLLVKDLNVYQLDYTGRADLTLLAATSALNAEPEVVYCEPNLASTVHENSVGPSLEPANALFKQQWDHRIIRTPHAWSFLQKLDNSKTFGSDNVRIVVIDTYFDQAKMKAHPSFKGKNVEICNIPTSEHQSSHGIACAGAASALTVSPPAAHNGPAGIAGNCRLTAIGIGTIVEDEGYLKVLQWIGGQSFKDMPSPPSATERVIVSQSQKFVSESTTVKGQIKTLSQNPAGPLFFVAAGNETKPMPDFLNDLAYSTGVCFIAASTVSNGIEKIAEYSNHGDGIFCCAPSGHCVPPPETELLAITPIHTLKCTEKKVYYANDPAFGDHLYRLNFTGTSYSTPVVAGIAALMLTANPFLTWQQVKTILAKTSDKICNSRGTYSTNPLAPCQDFPHSKRFGHGRVNAVTAVKHASFFFETPQIMAVDLNQTLIHLRVQNCWPGTLSLSVNSTEWTLPNGSAIPFHASLNGTFQTLQIVVQRNNSSTTTGELTIYHELSGQAFTVSLT